MKRALSKKILTIILLAFCGQALASPFFNCCVEMTHEQENGVVLDHQTMGMDAHSHDMDMMLSDAAQNYNSMSLEIEAVGCEHMCDICLGAATSVLGEPEKLVKLEGSSLNYSDYIFFNTSSNLDSPFRPPIIA